jgi:hypothetical protein
MDSHRALLRRLGSCSRIPRSVAIWRKSNRYSAVTEPLRIGWAELLDRGFICAVFGV